MRIAFAGKMGSGKTTAAQYLAERYGFTKISFADPIRRLAREIYGDVKNDERRRFMQLIGQGARSLNQDIWLMPVRRWLEEHPGASVVIDDVRFRNELSFCASYSFVVYRIESQFRLERLKQRDGFVPSEAALEDVSETDLDGYTLPLIRNDGTLIEFYNMLDKVVYELAQAEDLHCRAFDARGSD